jgi:hypothetical protein
VLSALCLTRSGKKTYDPADARVLRRDYLDAIGLPDYEEIFDIKSEIPRVTDLVMGVEKARDLNYDYWECDGLEREYVKKLGMRVYFEKSKATYAWHAVSENNFNNNMKAYRDIRDSYPAMLAEMFEGKNRVWDALRAKFTPIGNEVFWWTSLIEMEIIRDFYDRTGNILLNVYDGFYGKKEWRDEVIVSVKTVFDLYFGARKDAANFIARRRGEIVGFLGSVERTTGRTRELEILGEVSKPEGKVGFDSEEHDSSLPAGDRPPTVRYRITKKRVKESELDELVYDGLGIDRGGSKKADEVARVEDSPPGQEDTESIRGDHTTSGSLGSQGIG